MQTTYDFNPSFGNLRARYLKRLQDLSVQIESLGRAITPEQYALEPVLRLAHIAHQLGGSGKTFGFPEISAQALDLELLCARAESEIDIGPLPEETALTLHKKIRVLQNLCRKAAKESSPLAKPAEVIESACALARFRVLVYLPDCSESTSALSHFLCQMGYEARWIQRLEDIPDALKETHIDGILIETDFNPDAYSQLERLQEQPHPPILYLSSDGSFQTRLTAVQLGGAQFHTLPFTPMKLIEKLERLIPSQSTEAHHVLVVDDDEILAMRYAIALERAGLKATVVSKPENALSALKESQVSLVLMDFYMPDCNGYELAGVLRQADGYLTLPIVFLSTESQLESILRDTSIGVEDFLTKPVTEKELISVVQTRVRRAAMLRQLIDQDAATGLLNHTRLYKELGLEIARAKRRKDAFSYAMIDIDHFKQVNDTFGHRVGDMVIKTLAQVLQQRLRRTDIVGRYGGEEFGVILPQADPEQALSVLTDVHNVFRGMEFNAGAESFRVSFSGGIACYPEYTTESSLIEAADQALYRAKRAGRDRLILNHNQD